MLLTFYEHFRFRRFCYQRHMMNDMIFELHRLIDHLHFYGYHTKSTLVHLSVVTARRNCKRKKLTR